MGVRTADHDWIRQDKKAQGARETAAHKGELIHNGPFLSIRQLHLEQPWNKPPEGQGRFFLVTFKNPIHVEKVRKQVMSVFGE